MRGLLFSFIFGMLLFLSVNYHKNSYSPLHLLYGKGPFCQMNQSSVLDPVIVTQTHNLRDSNPNDRFIFRYRSHQLVDASNAEDYIMRDVYLIVVNFHFVMYNYTSFIVNEIYGNFAKRYPYDFDIVMFGPQQHYGLRVLSNGLPKAGFYSYHSMAAAIEEFSPAKGYNYAGYFLANDDSCLQPTLLAGINHKKAMMEPTNSWNADPKWVWNSVPNIRGSTFSAALMSAVDEINGDPSLSSKCKLNKMDLLKGWGDFFYFPSSYLSTFLSLEKILFDKGVFLECAVPILLSCANATVIDDCNHGNMPKRKTCAHLHPLKFSKNVERNICLNRIKNITLLEKPNTWYTVC